MLGSIPVFIDVLSCCLQELEKAKREQHAQKESHQQEMASLQKKAKEASFLLSFRLGLHTGACCVDRGVPIPSATTGRWGSRALGAAGRRSKLAPIGVVFGARPHGPLLQCSPVSLMEPGLQRQAKKTSKAG